MAKYLNLQVPQGCSEDWNAMLPEQKGKFCLSCQKQVIDFTTMNDRELIEFFKNHKGSTCGRFNSEQLNRDILIPSKKIPWLKYFFQFTLPAFLLSLKASGQIAGKSKPMVEAVPLIKGKALAGDVLVHKSETVQGVVKDEKGQPIAGATVMVKGTSRGVATDTLGRYLLKDLPLPAVLTLSAVGYTIQELRIDSAQAEVNTIMLTQQLTGTLGEVVVVGYAIPSRRLRNKSVKKELCTKPASPSLSVYPNPVNANNPLHLKWQGLPSGKYLVEVYSISGALMQSQKLSIENRMTEYALNAQQLATGNYLIRLVNQKTGKFLTQQVVVEK